MLCANCIKDVNTIVKNPQAHVTFEQLCQSISIKLWTMLHTCPPDSIDQTNDIMDTCFATAA